MEGWVKIILVIWGMVMGAVMGSFACCQAWRIRMREEGKNLGKRSVCLSCGKKLRWYENIPIVSWVVQKGRCRGCGKKIGKAEIVCEVLGAVIFGVLFWAFLGKYEKLVGVNLYDERGLAFLVIQSVIVVIFTTIMFVLAIYDARWRVLPTKLLYAGIAVGAIYLLTKMFEAEGVSGMDWFGMKMEMEGWMKVAIEAVGAVAILGGVYYLLYFFSKEKLVGGGDYILGTAIALVMGTPWLALWVLFLSNFLGVLVMVPMRKKKFAFGPFLFAAFAIVFVVVGVFGI